MFLWNGVIRRFSFCTVFETHNLIKLTSKWKATISSCLPTFILLQECRVVVQLSFLQHGGEVCTPVSRSLDLCYCAQYMTHKIVYSFCRLDWFLCITWRLSVVGISWPTLRNSSVLFGQSMLLCNFTHSLFHRSTQHMQLLVACHLYVPWGRWGDNSCSTHWPSQR